MGRTLDMALLGRLQHFEKLTHAKAIDVVERNGYVFIVEETDIGKAIGRGGAMIKKLEQTMQRPVQIIAFSSDPVTFVRNLLYPICPKQITREGDEIVITDDSSQIKGRIIGRDRGNLTWVNTVVSRHFGHIKVNVV